jgi:hypothetical protein
MTPSQRPVLAALGFAAAVHGCASPVRGPAPELPPRPALGPPIDRVGRALTGNALIGPLDPDDASDRRKEAYNRADPPAWPAFAADLQRTLALYDAFDGACGNQWLAERTAAPAARYRVLAATLADDRLWIDSASTACTQYLAIERDALGAPHAGLGDCGGRTPTEDVVDVFRSLLVLGAPAGVDDGIAHDDRVHSTTEFPFLAAP